VLVAAALLALVAGYFLWFRDSSLVAVDEVEVVGVESDDRAQIVAELTRVAEGMTTLHPDAGRIEAAAQRFPTIESVSVEMGFPDRARIEVTEHEPTAVVGFGEERVAVAPDGSLMPGVSLPKGGLPQIETSEGGGERLQGEALEQALVLGAAPAELRPLIDHVDADSTQGVEVTLRGGIPVSFGPPDDAGAKWRAAAAVLADPKLEALCRLDVRVPRRPAAGCAG
jgi:cell division septal protein FtsQ